jgi:hypothetical protein
MPKCKDCKGEFVAFDLLQGRCADCASPKRAEYESILLSIANTEIYDDVPDTVYGMREAATSVLQKFGVKI